MVEIDIEFLPIQGIQPLRRYGQIRTGNGLPRAHTYDRGCYALQCCEIRFEVLDVLFASVELERQSADQLPETVHHQDIGIDEEQIAPDPLVRFAHRDLDQRNLSDELSVHHDEPVLIIAIAFAETGDVHVVHPRRHE